jgi:hypothetical protein
MRGNRFGNEIVGRKEGFTGIRILYGTLYLEYP